MRKADVETAAPPSRALRNGPIHEDILRYLRQDIVEGRWQAGDRLPEPELCERFGVSRTPLRDALKRLETEGLVRLLPHVGAAVTALDPPDLMEKVVVLSGLEQNAAAHVAARQDGQVLARIRLLHTAMAHAARQGERARYAALNDDFHAAIVSGSENRTLQQLHETMMWHIHRARHRMHAAMPLAPDAASHHEEIVRALLAGDADGAILAVRHHLNDVARTMLASLEPMRGDAPLVPTI